MLRSLPIAAALVWSATGCSIIPHASVTPRYGPLEPDGDLAVSSGPTSIGSTVDGLGFDEDRGVFSPRADLSFGGFDLLLTGYEGDFSGEGTAEAQLDLGTVVISQGDPVASSLDLMVLNGALTYDFVPTRLVDFGLGLGARAVAFDGEIRSLTTGLSIASDESFILPTLAARAGAALGPVKLSLDWSGLSGSASGVDAEIQDFDLMASLDFESFLGFYGALSVGYRFLVVDVEYEEDGGDVAADLEFSGPFFGLTLGL